MLEGFWFIVNTGCVVLFRPASYCIPAQ